MKELSSNDERRLYGDLAWTFPIISPPEDYIEESELFSKVIREHARIGVRTLLDLGCGGGHNDYTFKKHFKVTGVDVSEAMLGLARRLNPENAYLIGDMRSVRLDTTFDAVTAFDSLAYMLTADDLRAAFETAFVHLEPGGVFLTCQEYSPERFEQNGIDHSVHTQGDVEITLIENAYDPNPGDTTFEATLVYLIRRGDRLQIETDRHLCGIFGLDTWLGLLREVGLAVKQMEFSDPSLKGQSIPMLVGLKPL